jgi:hypothetical protein
MGQSKTLRRNVLISMKSRDDAWLFDVHQAGNVLGMAV